MTYNVVVTNGSAQDTLTLNTLTDDVYGNITTVHGQRHQHDLRRPGQVPQTIAAGWQLHLFVCGKDHQL